jgi:hypothetical protein
MAEADFCWYRDELSITELVPGCYFSWEKYLVLIDIFFTVCETLPNFLYLLEFCKNDPCPSRGDVLTSRLSRRQITGSLVSAAIFLRTAFYSLGS